MIVATFFIASEAESMLGPVSEFVKLPATKRTEAKSHHVFEPIKIYLVKN
jgi:hypothetical protein